VLGVMRIKGSLDIARNCKTTCEKCQRKIARDKIEV
jgi:hypothetical protein